MSLGTSIFLSSILLGFVALYIATKDRWNWKKIILWPLAVSILLTGGVGVYFWIDYRLDQRPKVATTLWDIPLGALESDVKFLKGAPKSVSKEKDKVEWTYIFDDHAGLNLYEVMFSNDKVWAIKYFGDDERTFGPGIQGVDLRDPLEKITKKFGPPSNVSASKDQLSRLYSFTKYQVAFELKENRVTGYGVFDPTIAPKGLGYKEAFPRDIFDVVAEEQRQKPKDRK